MDRWSTATAGPARARSSTSTTCSTGASQARDPVLEEVPLEEKVRARQPLLKSRVRDVEDSLAQLVHEEDQVIAATAIHFVEPRGLWSLEGDLEYALEHRDARDWHVFEAASWALAARRMAAEERGSAGWSRCPRSSSPIACGGCRSSTSCRSTSCSGSRSGPPGAARDGQLLYEQGTRPDNLQFLLDGAVSRRATTSTADRD